MRNLTTNFQEGFSAIGIFIMGLALLIIMSSLGFFVPPKSPTNDNTIYTATGANKINNDKGLHMIDLSFTTPTSPPTTPVPTIAVQATPTPACVPPPGNYCPPDTERTECDCNPCKPIDVYCGGNLPPAPASCQGDTPACRSRAENDPTCHWYCMGKPVIYLYVEKPTFVNVALLTPGRIVESIPLIESGKKWQNILALPGGVLRYNDNYYRELYYESSVEKVNAPDNGIFIKTDDLKLQLKTQTEKLGLLPNESQEFVDYWLPRLQSLNKPYIFFSVISKEEKERTDGVEIKPAPDVFIQFIAYFKGVDSPSSIRTLRYPAVPKRTGFTAVEWGGVIDRQ